jgi:hypothetical protein
VAEVSVDTVQSFDLNFLQIKSRTPVCRSSWEFKFIPNGENKDGVSRVIHWIGWRL